jgi:hypothetical protein
MKNWSRANKLKKRKSIDKEEDGKEYRHFVINREDKR